MYDHLYSWQTNVSWVKLCGQTLVCIVKCHAEQILDACPSLPITVNPYNTKNKMATSNNGKSSLLLANKCFIG
jgi:hypothetical protein